MKESGREGEGEGEMKGEKRKGVARKREEKGGKGKGKMREKEREMDEKRADRRERKGKQTVVNAFNKNGLPFRGKHNWIQHFPTICCTSEFKVMKSRIDEIIVFNDDARPEWSQIVI